MIDEAAGFERIRRRTGPARTGRADPASRDPQGRDSLFSSTVPSDRDCGSAGLPPLRPTPFTALVECSRCDERTAMTLARVARQAVPGLHLPWLRRGHGSLMRCPACGRLSWVSVRVGL